MMNETALLTFYIFQLNIKILFNLHFFIYAVAKTIMQAHIYLDREGYLKKVQCMYFSNRNRDNCLVLLEVKRYTYDCKN